MKKINLSKDKVAIVDDEDYQWLNQWKWSYNGTYAVRNDYINGRKYKRIYMHRVLMNNPVKVVDHINRNPLDNRKKNLRVVTIASNIRNGWIRKNNTSGYFGVYFRKDIKRWAAQIHVNKKHISLGCFSNPEEAEQARIKAGQLYV